MARSPRTALAVFLAAVALGGCGIVTSGGAAPEGPEQAFDRLKGALRSRDWGAVYDSATAPSTRRFFENDFERMRADLLARGAAGMFAESVLGVPEDEYARMSARDFFIRVSQVSGRPAGWTMMPAPEAMRTATVVDTEVEGDQATLTVRLEDGLRPMSLFREEGGWYFQLLDDD